MSSPSTFVMPVFDGAFLSIWTTIEECRSPFLELLTGCGSLWDLRERVPAG